jgi:uncharacterized short protein YbdD (DUF466 family)
MRQKLRSIRLFLRQARSVIKTIFGMPDYDRYLKHWYANHAAPGQFPMSEKEYYMYALRERYERGGITRCC